MPKRLASLSRNAINPLLTPWKRARGDTYKSISQYDYYLKGLTEKEIRLISEELRKRKSGHSKRVELSDRELVEFLASTEVIEGELGKNRLRALENKTVIDCIEVKQALSTEHTSPNINANSKISISNNNDEIDSQELQNVEDDLDQLEYFGEFCL